MIHFQWYPFSELSVDQLYAVLKLRAEIFVVDQNCAYLDPDDKDRFALHLLGIDESGLAAYLRVFPPSEVENYIVFGRVVTAKRARAQGYGKQMLQEFFRYCDVHFPKVTVQCSAQYYLKKFYEGFGLKAYGEVYQEDNIPHIAMRKEG